jgi:hypothetical protein
MTRCKKSKKSKKQVLQDLFARNYQFILDAALANRDILAPDAERIVDDLAKDLHGYHGKLLDRPFLTWATKIVKKETQRIAQFYEMRTKYELFVFEGIWRVLRTARDLADYAGPDGDTETARDIADEVWLWAFEKLDSLLSPDNTAKPSTRLFVKAYWIARAWKTRRLRERRRFPNVEVEHVGTDLQGGYIVEPDFHELEAVGA